MLLINWWKDVDRHDKDELKSIPMMPGAILAHLSYPDKKRRFSWMRAAMGLQYCVQITIISIIDDLSA